MTNAGGVTVENIAIIGMAGRFPGAENISEFWRNLERGVDSVQFLSDEELLAVGADPEEIRRPSYVKAHSSLTGPELFDAEFFGFTPREAELTDPQQRVFLECAWHAFEDAGYDPHTYSGRISVFAGQTVSSYFYNNICSYPDWQSRFDGLKVTIGNHPASLATRIAHKLNLRGPAVNLQTACSTSLVAVHLACQSLLTYESDIGLAGGVSINFPLWHGYHYEEGGILSPDGHCRTFDAKANGTVGGSGIGLIVLKRLSEAIGDGDQIYAVIRGTAINNDGSDKVGYTAPSVAGQADVVAAAHLAAGVPATAITYVETHGTATPMGDPIEIAALNRVFPVSTQNEKSCALGAVKASVGHLDAAAGVTGLIKTALALRHKRIPPCVHFNEPNPQLGLEKSPFYIPRQAEDWKSSDRPRLAGVSSFGIGGTNAHVVLEEAPAALNLPESKEGQILVLSARTDTALLNLTQNLITHLEQYKNTNLADLAHTLQVGRHEFACRRAIVCGEGENAIEALRRSLHSKPSKAESDPPVYFLFPGQGAQHEGMAAGLYASEQVFRESIDRSAEIAKQIVNFDFRQHLWGNKDGKASAHSLDDTLVTQLVMFSVDYALAQWWLDLGVKPKAMIGHSVGEYVAAAIAGVLAHEDAISLVCKRAALMQSLPRGTMLSVALSEREIRNILPAGLDLAAVNTPLQCVVAGPTESVAEFQALLQQQNVHCKVLRTSHAFHSAMMEPAREAVAMHVAAFNLKPPVIPYISNVTGQLITAEETTSPAYWGRHLRQTVRFAQGCSHLAREQSGIFLEVGPGRTLTGLVRQMLERGTGSQAVASLEDGANAASDREALLKTIGTLWTLGKKIRWAPLWQGKARCCISVPGYPFERQKYFIEPACHDLSSKIDAQQAQRITDLSKFFFVPVWKQSTQINSGKKVENKAPWVIFCGHEDFGCRFAAWLEDNSYSVIRVAAPATQLQNAHRTSTPDDYSSILRDLEKAGIRPAVLVLPLLGPRTADPMSLISLAQALQERNSSDPVHVQVVIDGLYRITGEETLNPEKALLLGPARVIPLEMPDVACGITEIAAHQAGSPAELRLFGKLQRDIAEGNRDLFVAYRNGHRWTCTFERVVLGELTSRRLRQGGVYIITGGASGIGLEIADFLARSEQARLVLIGRSPIPAENCWEDWLAKHSPSDKTSRLISRIKKMKAAGAQVLAISADITDTSQVNAAVETAIARFGKIHGLIHAAGVAGGGILASQSRETMERCLRGKTSGLILLEQALSDQQLDLVVLFSSHMGIHGSAGRADYTAANAFLDCYAHSRSGAATHIIAIDWDTWAETGMAAAEAERLHVSVTDRALTNAEGVEAFRRAIESDFPQIIISTSYFTGRLQEAADKPAIQAESTDPAQPELSRHPRPHLLSVFAAPQTVTEITIIDLWEDMLGIAGIGIDDNFFELGGDSVVSIQFIAKLRKKGITVSPKQVFEHATPRSLAELIDQGCARVEAEQGVVIGPILLTPIQHWFCEQKLVSPYHFNQDTLVSINGPVHYQALDSAFQAILKQHDTLRLRLEEAPTGWRQWIADYEYVPLEKYDFIVVPEEQQSAAIEAKASEIQKSLDLKNGPIARLVTFDTGHGNPARMLITVHHLAIDGVSWNILLEDLETAYGQLRRGEAVKLPAKTTSFKYWAQKLEAQARLKSIEKESTYWLAEKRGLVQPLPRDFNGGANTQETLRSISISLTEPETKQLLQKATALGTHMNEVLLAALSCSLQKWSGQTNMLLDVEGLGRDPLFDDVDLSRTVGWFTAIYPLAIYWEAEDSLNQRLSLVKAQASAVPGRGFGYGLLRYMTGNSRIAGDLRRLPQAEISFLYSGQSGQDLPQDSLFGIANESGGVARDPRQGRAYLIDIYIRIFEGRLNVSWSYSSSIHKESTIQGLSDSFKATLLSMLQLADSQQFLTAMVEATEFGWDEFELNKIRKAIEESITSKEYGAS